MRWEYKTVEYKKRHLLTGKISMQELQTELDNLGRQGWELVNLSRDTNGLRQMLMLIFKRQI